MPAKKSCEMRSPHSRRQTVSADVRESKEKAIGRLLNGEEVRGQVANTKDFAGYLELIAEYNARRTQTPMNLSRFKYGSVQIRIVLLKCGDLSFQLNNRVSRRSTSRPQRDLNIIQMTQ